MTSAAEIGTYVYCIIPSREPRSFGPLHLIDTAAIRNVVGAELANRSRTPEIMADAAHAILTKPSREATGNFYRAFTVREEVDPDRIAAELKYGVLTVRLPRPESARPRRITVQGE